MGMRGEFPASGDEPVDQPVGGGGVVQGHAQPNIVQVAAGARRSRNAARVGLSGLCSAGPPDASVPGA
jgi:hypothetical protein